MTKILIVDDEEKIRAMITKYARHEGFETDEAGDGMEAVEKCEKNDYDLVIMDVMMPELDGFSAVKEIKKAKPDMPFIMLSALGEEYDKIHGFDVGVDDYVVKPFSSKELMMRIQAIMKRTEALQAAPKVSNKECFVSHGLEVDFAARAVRINGQNIDMTPKEYDLFFYMVRNRGLALTRENLITNVWGYDYYGDDRTLDTHIKLLRKSLGDYADRIVTLRGVGYRFEEK